MIYALTLNRTTSISSELWPPSWVSISSQQYQLRSPSLAKDKSFGSHSETSGGRIYHMGSDSLMSWLDWSHMYIFTPPENSVYHGLLKSFSLGFIFFLVPPSHPLKEYMHIWRVKNSLYTSKKSAFKLYAKNGNWSSVTLIFHGRGRAEQKKSLGHTIWSPQKKILFTPQRKLALNLSPLIKSKIPSPLLSASEGVYDYIQLRNTIYIQQDNTS